jgi:hypothetical protein
MHKIFFLLTSEETAKEHGRQLKEAAVHQRHRKRHRLATAPLRRRRLATSTVEVPARMSAELVVVL